MTKLRLLSALFACLAGAQPAEAAWERIASGLAREPVRSLSAVGGGLVILGVKQVTVAEAAGLRRSFTLASQNDALTGFAAAAGVWYLASRRALWRSDDLGFSWQKSAALPPRDPNAVLALGLDGAAPVVATAEGVRRPGPSGFEPYGPLGRAAIASALGKDGRLLVTANRGLFVVAGAAPRKVAAAGLGAPRAFIAAGDELLLAGATGVLQCAAACRSVAALTDVRDFARTPAGYFAAATDGVFRIDGSALASTGGGLDGAPAALAATSEALYTATALGVFKYVAEAPAAPPVESDDAPVAEPSIDEVRRMVLDAHPFLREGSDSWRERARWRAAAPRLGVSVSRALDEKSGLTRGDTIALSTTENRLLIGPNGEATSRSSGRGVDYGLTLTWELEALVFNPLEINVSNELEDLFRLRESIVIDVTRVFFDRLRVRRQLAAEKDAAKRGELALRLGELTAQLDFYTEGRFSARLAPEGP